MQIFDIHTHILPQQDDGAKSMEMCCGMARLAAGQGCRTVIATPHSYGREKTGPDQIREKCRMAEERIRQETGCDFSVYPGQEIFYRDSIIGELDEKKLLTLGDSSYVLVEFSPQVVYSYLHTAVRKFQGSGYRMILAHAERYGCLRKEEHLEELLHAGVYLQINARTVGGSFFDVSARWCRKQLQEHRIHFVASDMHNLEERSPDYTGALGWMEKHLDTQYREDLCWGNARSMVSGLLVRNS